MSKPETDHFGMPACRGCPTHTTMRQCSATLALDEDAPRVPWQFNNKDLKPVTFMVNPEVGRLDHVVYARDGREVEWLVADKMAAHLGPDRVAVAAVAEIVTAQGQPGIWMAPANSPGKGKSSWHTSATAIVLEQRGRWLRLTSDTVHNRYVCELETAVPLQEPQWSAIPLMQQLNTVFYGRIVANLRDLERFERTWG